MESLPRRPSALPSARARVVAFAAIVLAGLCGSLIGWSLAGLECDGACAVPESIGVFVGGVLSALGVAVVAVLALRAMAEWRGQLELDD